MSYTLEWDWKGWWISDNRGEFSIRHNCWVYIGKDTSLKVPDCSVYVCVIGPLRFQIEVG